MNEKNPQTEEIVVEAALTVSKTELQLADYKPRDMQLVKKKCLKEAELFGLYDLDKAVYSLSRRGRDGQTTAITGASIGLAMMIFRNFGNLKAGGDEIARTPEGVIFRGAVIDMETNTYFTRQLFQPIPQHYKPDMQANLWGAGQSKAIRNAILAVVPSWLVQDCINTAKEAAVKNIKDNPAYRQKIQKRLLALGASEWQIAKRWGAEADWTKETLVEIVSVGAALRDGETTIETEFEKDPSIAPSVNLASAATTPVAPPPSDKPSVADVAAKIMSLKKDMFEAKDFKTADAQRAAKAILQFAPAMTSAELAGFDADTLNEMIRAALTPALNPEAASELFGGSHE